MRTTCHVALSVRRREPRTRPGKNTQGLSGRRGSADRTCIAAGSCFIPVFAHFGANEPRPYRADADAFARQFLGQVAGEGVDRTLASGVDDVSGKSAKDRNHACGVERTDLSDGTEVVRGGARPTRLDQDSDRGGLIAQLIANRVCTRTPSVPAWHFSSTPTVDFARPRALTTYSHVEIHWCSSRPVLCAVFSARLSHFGVSRHPVRPSCRRQSMDDGVTGTLIDDRSMTDLTASANHGAACGGTWTSFTSTSRFTATYRPPCFATSGSRRISGPCGSLRTSHSVRGGPGRTARTSLSPGIPSACGRAGPNLALARPARGSRGSRPGRT